MNIFERIKTLFGSQKLKVSNQESEVRSQETDSEISLMPTFNENSALISNSQFLTPNSQNVPHWLENEDALRDEGVIFGLSDSKAEEKTAIIRNYFSNQTANIEKEIEQFSEKIGELNLLIGQKETRMDELKEKSRWLETRTTNADHFFPRTLAGLILSVAMAVGNYFLIETSIQHNFPDKAWLISLGVFLAGMFSLFNPKSLFHERNDFSWRQILEEVGMPLAASLFVFVQSLDNQSVIKSIALFVFVFFLFLFSGKLLLGNLTVFKNDFTVFWDNQILRRDKVVKTKEWDKEIQQLTKEIDEQRIKKWQIVPDLNRAEAELTRLNAQRDMMIKLFESEFHLARNYREKLTGKQMKEILK